MMDPNCRMKEKVIVAAIKDADVMVRKKFQFLANQDMIASVIFVVSSLGIVGCWYSYSQNRDSPVSLHAVLICGVAFFASILHELEHDLIHNLYFRKYSLVQDFMFLIIWIFKLHGNPWMRRDLHLKHHIVSGQIDDAEERLIGLGQYWGLQRLAMTMHPFGQPFVISELTNDAKWLNIKKLLHTSAVAGVTFFFLTNAFITHIVLMHYFPVQYAASAIAPHWWWIRDAIVMWVVPGLLRSACLVLMSNCSHYYGDIPEKTLFYQNQILDHWALTPFQLFCCNFGATHIVHHYVPGQPFYIRTLVYARVKALMVEQGVRINDFGIVARGNRYFEPNQSSALATSTVQEKEVKGEDVKEDEKGVGGEGGVIAPNNSCAASLVTWLLMCTTVGALCFPMINAYVAALYTDYSIRSRLRAWSKARGVAMTPPVGDVMGKHD